MWRGPYPNLWLTMRMVEFIWAPEMSNDTHLIFCFCAWKHYKQWIGNLIVCLTFVTEIFTLFVFPLSSTFKFLSCWINMLHGCSLKNTKYMYVNLYTFPFTKYIQNDYHPNLIVYFYYNIVCLRLNYILSIIFNWWKGIL